jgi:hypothetical protein
MSERETARALCPKSFGAAKIHVLNQEVCRDDQITRAALTDDGRIIADAVQK